MEENKNIKEQPRQKIYGNIIKQSLISLFDVENRPTSGLQSAAKDIAKLIKQYDEQTQDDIEKTITADTSRAKKQERQRQAKYELIALLTEVLVAPARVAKPDYQENFNYFQTALNQAFGLPHNNPWQDTLLGVENHTILQSVANQKQKSDNACVINGAEYFSQVKTTQDGWVMTTLSLKEQNLPHPEQMADITSHWLSLYPHQGKAKHNEEDSIVDFQKEIKSLAKVMEAECQNNKLSEKPYELNLSCLRAFRKNGSFRVVGTIGDELSALVYNSKINTCTVLPKYVDRKCQEGEFIILLDSKIMELLPKIEEDDSRIDMANISKPSKMSASSVAQAFVNYAKSVTTAKGKPLTEFTITALELTNPLDPQHILTKINPANITPFAAVAAAIGFGLKAFASPEIFAAAAPYLTGIAIIGVGLAGVMLLAYVVTAIGLDMKRQWESGKLHNTEEYRHARGVKSITNELNEFNSNEKITTTDWIKIFVGNYFSGIADNMESWASAHKGQVAMIIVTTLLMLVVGGFAMTYVIDPNLLANIGITPIFDLISSALATGFTHLGHLTSDLFGFDVGFQVGSTICNELTLAVSALIPVIALDAGRRITAGLYEAFADEGEKAVQLPKNDEDGKGIQVSLNDEELVEEDTTGYFDWLLACFENKALVQKVDALEEKIAGKEFK